ncbi:MAG: hypothetical protein IIW81_01720, partial [Oscillospiraceae bacterium]|nr:hypothetical protein [Oscillospiraceae bacterium]
MLSGFFRGEPSGIRTPGTLIKSQVTNLRFLAYLSQVFKWLGHKMGHKTFFIHYKRISDTFLM